MKELIKKLQSEISKCEKHNAKILKKTEREDYDMDDHDDIMYNDGFMSGLGFSIELLKKQK
jgi:hypothetical protein